MNYDGAKGWLVGEPEKGLAGMFIMMNAARLGVGLQGLAQGEVAYQNAASYARERRQGRALNQDERDPDAKADPIIVHPDVRRMLMEVARMERGGPGAGAVGRAPGRPDAPLARRGGAAERRRPARADHAGDQGLSDRQGFPGGGLRSAGARRAWLHSRARHGTVRARCADHPDLRGHQRHPGDGPGRSQAAQGRRPGGAQLSSSWSAATSPRRKPRAIQRASLPPSSPPCRTSRPQRCGLPRTAWPIPTMPERAPIPTWT